MRLEDVRRATAAVFVKASGAEPSGKAWQVFRANSRALGYCAPWLRADGEIPQHIPGYSGVRKKRFVGG